MIRLSRAARAQVTELAKHYEDRDRPEAIRNLRAAIARAAERIEAQRGRFYPAPRPYPDLMRRGWLWLKEGPYWIAYAADPGGAVIQVVFYETANMPKRI